MAKDKTKQAKVRPWRKATRQAMRESTEKEAEQRYGTADPPFNYRWEHVTAVVTLAQKLADLTGADPEVIEAAAWLHDVCKQAKERHPYEGARFARKLLARTDFPAQKIDHVATVIEDHMGLWRDEPLQNLESMVLWDADKLAKIGITAAIHWLGGDLAGGKPRTTRELLERLLAVDWHHKTVASMHTQPARRAARTRLKAYRRLCKSLASELDGTDLNPKK